MFDKKRIAIVYDWMDKWGGVERVLLSLHTLFQHAHYFTSYYNPQTAVWAKELEIKTSFIQTLPSWIRTNRILSVPLYPYAFESFKLNDYDLVISVSSSFAKSVITRPETLHISYLLTPTRFLWSHTDTYINHMAKLITEPYLKKLREWDYIAAQRADYIVSISGAVKERCKKYYSRSSEIIYPPFDAKYWEKLKNSKHEIRNLKKGINNKYFLVVSRLEKYKRVDLAIQAFNNLKGKTLIIVGKGNEEKSLKSLANGSIIFLKDISDEELAQLYSHAEALIMPQEEDFGYVSLEAQFFGCPVIAYNAGGSTETVVEDKTGIFVHYQSVASLLGALERFDSISYNLKTSTQKYGEENVQRFGNDNFKKQLLKMLTKYL